ncbi:hypothetical protein [Bombiscardovia apis]|uniref:hypothetical protein n=1 Tax=Bombiscardovia apis TaxID=2932182 RepID=UPI0029542068|nr:hypothetical protein [Bombiscardovia apis]
MIETETTQVKSCYMRQVRNSNFEILRLIAMFLILLFHFPWDETRIVITSSPAKGAILSVLVAFLSNWGKVGDALFFMLSSWFLCEEQQNLKKNLHRAWVLEIQILFYSILTVSSPFTILCCTFRTMGFNGFLTFPFRNWDLVVCHKLWSLPLHLTFPHYSVT